MIYGPKTPLFFNNGSVLEWFRVRQQDIDDAIDNIGDNEILRSEVSDISKDIIKSYVPVTPIILKDNIAYDEPIETDVDITSDYNYIVLPGSRGVAKGFMITFCVPFEGTSDLFDCKPTQWSSSYPHGYVSGNELRFEYEYIQETLSAVDARFKSDFGKVDQWLGWIKEDVEKNSPPLKNRIENKLRERRERLLKQKTDASQLAYKIRKRSDSSDTYSVDLPRDEYSPMPQISSGAIPPHPTLAEGRYQEVLRILNDYSKSIERTPDAFRGLGEEHIRDLILAHLNGRYSGSATGETFSKRGKTDIMIMHESGPIFIAECKLWNGQKYYLDGLNQLFTYITWRDTKTAMLVFNRNKHPTAVMQTISEVMESHQGFIRKEPSVVAGDNQQYIMKHPGDELSQVMVSVLLYDVP